MKLIKQPCRNFSFFCCKIFRNAEIFEKQLDCFRFASSFKRIFCVCRSKERLQDYVSKTSIQQHTAQTALLQGSRRNTNQATHSAYATNAINKQHNRETDAATTAAAAARGVKKEPRHKPGVVLLFSAHINGGGKSWSVLRFFLQILPNLHFHLLHLVK